MKLFGSPWYIRDNLNVAFFVKKLSNLSWHLPQKRIAPLLYLVINMTDWLSKDCVEVAVSPSNSLGKAVKRLVPICIFTGCLVHIIRFEPNCRMQRISKQKMIQSAIFRTQSNQTKQVFEILKNGKIYHFLEYSSHPAILLRFILDKL